MILNGNGFDSITGSKRGEMRGEIQIPNAGRIGVDGQSLAELHL